MIKYESTDNNCLQCCIAGMFDKPLDDVPHVLDWKERYPNWYDGFHNFSLIFLNHVPVAVVDDTLDDLFHIAVFSEVGRLPHCVIAKGMDVVWDPHPSNKIASLADTENWEYSIVFVEVHGLTLQQACQASYVQWAKEKADEAGITGESRE